MSDIAARVRMLIAEQTARARYPVHAWMAGALYDESWTPTARPSRHFQVHDRAVWTSGDGTAVMEAAPYYPALSRRQSITVKMETGALTVHAVFQDTTQCIRVVTNPAVMDRKGMKVRGEEGDYAERNMHIFSDMRGLCGADMTSTLAHAVDFRLAMGAFPPVASETIP